MKKLIKELFFRVAPARSIPPTRAVILMYHAISDEGGYFFSVSPAAFERQMTYLAETRRTVISLAELVRRLREREPLGGCVVITFDDGYRDNLIIAAPILERYGFPATIFVTTGLVGKTDARKYTRLTSDDLRTLESSGLISIEPHTISHPKLAQVGSDEARQEIVGSKKALEELLRKQCEYFAYPYGSHTKDTATLVEGMGFKAAVTVAEGTVGSESDLYRLPRVSIDRSTTQAQFAGKTSQAVDWYERIKLWR